jgi:hypothetical protein
MNVIRRHEIPNHPQKMARNDYRVTCPICNKVRDKAHVKLAHGISFEEANKR